MDSLGYLINYDQEEFRQGLDAVKVLAFELRKCLESGWKVDLDSEIGPCQTCGALSSSKWHEPPQEEGCLCSACFKALQHRVQLQAWGETEDLTFSAEQACQWVHSKAVDSSILLEDILRKAASDSHLCDQGSAE